MKFVLIVMWVASSLGNAHSKEWNEVEMQEFSSEKACISAAKHILNNSRSMNVYCIEK